MAGQNNCQPFRLLIVDDDELARYVLRLSLSAREDLTVVGEAGNGREAIESTERLNPDVVVMDMLMPIMSGIEATRQILEQQSHVKIFFFSSQEANEAVLEAFQAGAHGYCLKDSKHDTLLAGLLTVVAGRRWIDPRLATPLSASLPELRTGAPGLNAAAKAD
ncbi:MAG TPA: response regulator transcription factor [Candidatus Obscuribacterales bacterium]